MFSIYSFVLMGTSAVGILSWLNESAISIKMAMAIILLGVLGTFLAFTACETKFKRIYFRFFCYFCLVEIGFLCIAFAMWPAFVAWLELSILITTYDLNHRYSKANSHHQERYDNAKG